MDPEVFNLLYEIKVMQRRRNLFTFAFSLFVILPTCVILSLSTLTPYLMLWGLGKASKESEIEMRREQQRIKREVDEMTKSWGLPQTQNFKK